VTETLTSRFEIRPVSPLIGAEIEGVDLTQPVADATAEALREAFWTYKVLVFRDQNLSPVQHVEAVRIFDEPFDHPLWVKRHPDNRLVCTFNRDKGTADRWHTTTAPGCTARSSAASAVSCGGRTPSSPEPDWSAR
jgi:alpha-ketoglutarate-dependent taurine dioxygenase